MYTDSLVEIEPCRENVNLVDSLTKSLADRTDNNVIVWHKKGAAEGNPIFRVDVGKFSFSLAFSRFQVRKEASVGVDLNPTRFDLTILNRGKNTSLVSLLESDLLWNSIQSQNHRYSEKNRHEKVTKERDFLGDALEALSLL